MRLLPVLLLLSARAWAEAGTLCLARATWADPKGAQPLGGRPPTPVRRFSVQVDDDAPVDVSEAPAVVEGLSRDARHRVRVFGDGLLRETFFFRFEGPALRLAYKPLYDSWWLRPVTGCGAH